MPTNHLYKPDYDNFGRRMSLAYDMTGEGKTVLRGGSPTLRRKASKPAFVELVAPARAQLEERVIEFESPGGSKMRIQWKPPRRQTGPPCCRRGGNGRTIQDRHAHSRVIWAMSLAVRKGSSSAMVG